MERNTAGKERMKIRWKKPVLKGVLLPPIARPAPPADEAEGVEASDIDRETSVCIPTPYFSDFSQLIDSLIFPHSLFISSKSRFVVTVSRTHRHDIHLFTRLVSIIL